MNWKMLCMLVALCGSCSLIGRAEAHAHPMNMTPPADAAVPAPAAVSITFNEGLEAAFSSLTVLDASGQAIASRKAELDSATHTTMRLALPALGAGIYTVKWVAVSRDGHRTNGSYHFTVK